MHNSSLHLHDCQVRNHKGRKNSKYAPEEGNRYDGIYKVKCMHIHAYVKCCAMNLIDYGCHAYVIIDHTHPLCVGICIVC